MEWHRDDITCYYPCNHLSTIPVFDNLASLARNYHIVLRRTYCGIHATTITVYHASRARTDELPSYSVALST